MISVKASDLQVPAANIMQCIQCHFTRHPEEFSQLPSHACYTPKWAYICGYNFHFNQRRSEFSEAKEINFILLIFSNIQPLLHLVSNVQM